MIHPELLKILQCPETHQELSLAEPGLIQKLNAQQEAGGLRNRAGRPVTDKLDGGLVRRDGKFLYPICRNLPIMLIDEAIPVEP